MKNKKEVYFSIPAFNAEIEKIDLEKGIMSVSTDEWTEEVHILFKEDGGEYCLLHFSPGNSQTKLVAVPVSWLWGAYPPEKLKTFTLS